MLITVQKYGGTSVGSPEKIQHVADRVIQAYHKTKHVVVVVSAMGSTTDVLIGLAKQLSLVPDPREYDALISTGENVSAALLSMALIQKGFPAISLTGAQAGILTESIHMRAKILTVDPSRIHDELSKERIVVVTGFQGVNILGEVTTIGRGGSDTSAVVLAAALNAQSCEIFTDVEGIYTTDPREVSLAKKIPEISYDEMLELASLGAGVLHPRAVECGKQHGVHIHVRSTFKPDQGSWVKETNMEVSKPVTGITASEEQVILSILNLSHTPGVAGQVFQALADAGINVDMIVQSVENGSQNHISFSVHEDDVIKAKMVSEKMAELLGANQVVLDEDVSKISIVGVGMISRPGIAAKMFSTLGNLGINIKRITTSEIKISCAISRKDTKKALETLHHVFDLDRS